MIRAPSAMTTHRVGTLLKMLPAGLLSTLMLYSGLLAAPLGLTTAPRQIGAVSAFTLAGYG
jgi:hypothetical protein